MIQSGLLHAWRGRHRSDQYLAEAPRALDLFQKALHIAETSGLKSFEWDMLNNVGAAFLASGDEAAAVDHFQKAHAVGSELANPRQQAWALTYLGGAYLARGNAESARESFARAQSLLPGVDEPWLLAQTLAGLGETAAVTGQPDTALAYFVQAVSVSQSAGDRLHTAMGRLALGRLGSPARPADVRPCQSCGGVDGLRRALCERTPPRC